MRYLTLLLFVLANSLAAQDFEVSPVLIEVNARQGRVSKDVMIFNHTDSPKIFNVKEYDFIIEDEGKKMSAEFGSTPRTLKGVLNISPSTLMLQPNEKSFFTVTIDPIVGSKMRWGN